jgi:hypothetical protein
LFAVVVLKLMLSGSKSCTLLAAFPALLLLAMGPACIMG